MTVIGKLNGGNEPHVFMNVPVGTSVGEMIERAGGIDGVYGEIIMGGPFTGNPTDLDAPVTKTTGGIIVDHRFPEPSRCKSRTSCLRMRRKRSTYERYLRKDERCCSICSKM